MKKENYELKESSNEEDNNPKMFSITPGLDLNKIPYDVSDPIKREHEEKQVIEVFKTPMRREVEKSLNLQMILENIKPIDYREVKFGDDYMVLKNQYENAHGDDKKSLLDKIMNMKVELDEQIVILTEHLLLKSEEKCLSLGFYNGQFYLFNGKYWKSLESDPLKLEFLGMVSEKSGLPPYIVRQKQVKNKLLDQFISTCSLPDVSHNVNEIKINFNNGTFIFANGKGSLHEYRKDDYLFYCLGFDYDPNAKAEVWQKFLDRVLPDPLCQDVLMEFIGYIFLKLNLAKGLILLGTGANGKSVINTIVEKIVGSENMCGYTLPKLCDSNGYTRAVLSNKMVNFSDEIGKGKYDHDTWKKLVSGGHIEARLPYGIPFMLENNCKFIFNANILPIAEGTHGFFRRMIIIPFNVTISEEEQDIELADKICSTDLPGIFNLVLEGMMRLVTKKRFTQSTIIDSMVSKYKKESDSVSLFIEDEQWIVSTENSRLLKDFYSLYRQYCNENGSFPLSNRKFSERLKLLGFKVLPGANHYTHVWCQKKTDIPKLDIDIVKSFLKSSTQ